MKAALAQDPAAERVEEPARLEREIAVELVLVNDLICEDVAAEVAQPVLSHAGAVRCLQIADRDFLDLQRLPIDLDLPQRRRDLRHCDVELQLRLLDGHRDALRFQLIDRHPLEFEPLLVQFLLPEAAERLVLDHDHALVLFAR